MIASDLDGTLLRSDGTVSDRTLAAIEGARRAGIEVVPATGRPRIITEDVMERLPFLDYWVLANGSVTWHLGRKELLRGFWIEAPLAKALVGRIRRQLPNAGFAVEFEDDVAFEAGFEAVVPIAPTADPTVDLVDRIDRRVQKLLVFDDGGTIDELFDGVSSAVGNDGVASYSGLSFIELAASEVTKATGLSLLADDLGITGDEVAAFGDNHNDVAMLNWAGRSYAMDHATGDAKGAAGETIGSNDDDAVADIIDELVAEVRS
jgi:Cof subfamily protein (haloacid dehalogenase superfamily)